MTVNENAPQVDTGSVCIICAFLLIFVFEMTFYIPLKRKITSVNIPFFILHIDTSC